MLHGCTTSNRLTDSATLDTRAYADRRAACVRRGLPGRAARRLLWCAVLILPIGTISNATAQQYAGAGCIATLENRSSPISEFGTFTLPNVPVDPINPSLYQLHIVCPQPDGSLLGATSAYQDLTTPGGVSIPLLPLGALTPQSQSLVIQAVSGSLSSVGATVQLAVVALLPNGAPTDATLLSEGTTYTTSNASVATVGANGLVTATGPGNVTVTARNDGLAATVMLSSFALIDSDGDGMPDVWEIANGLNPYDPTDAGLDPDGDGLTNLQEYQLGTNPHVADTDGDGLSDGYEVQIGTNPLVADTDGDGLSDGQEVTLGTNPLNPDTDGDGIPDGIEVKIGTNPLVFDITTTVTGYVTNGDGSPHPGASVVVLTYFTGVTDSTGAFTLLHVPITLGNVIASAEAIVNGTVYGGSSTSTTPVGNGATNVGTIQLGLSGGQVSGTVTTPDNKPDPGVQVVVTGGADTRTAITDGNGLYAVTGLQVGAVAVAALDPTTSLRGQAMGVLGAGSPLTLNVKLAAYGTISGTVRNVAGSPVGAGVTVSINGVLNTTTTTNTLGQYTFSFVPLGGVTLNANDSNGNQGRTTALVTATSQTISADIQYLGRGTVTGVVTDGTGKAVGGVAVSLSNTGQFYQSLNTNTNSIGQYTFSNVFVGVVNLSAVSVADASGGTASAAITTNGQTVTANIMLQPTATISGTVYRSDGKTPVANATITMPYSALSATTNSTGNFTIANLPLSTYTVDAADPGSLDRGNGSVALTTAGQTVPMTIDMIGLGALNVTVTDGGGNPHAGALITVNTNGPFNQTQTGVSASDGTAAFTQELAGSVSVSATDPATNLGGRAQLTLAAGATTPVSVMLQSAGTIQGTVYQLDGKTPVVGTTVQLDQGQQVSTNSAGAYVLTIVPSGSHSVTVLDAHGNFLASNNSITISTQGQVITANFVIIGRGTVTGQVTFSDGTDAAGLPVTITSFANGDSNPLSTQTDINGLYVVPNVPVGNYTVVSQQHTITTNSYGTSAGSMPSDGATVATNVQLSSSLVPATQNFTDANGQLYPVRETGALIPGAFTIFDGDTNIAGQIPGTHVGGSVLSIVQNGTETPFTGEEFAPITLNAQQISIEQDGLDGLNITRRVYVPGDGYFARYVELISNPGAQNITVDVKLTTNYRNIIKITQQNGFQSETIDPPHILLTSSGDNILNIADPTNPDNWLTLGGPIDDDPFIASIFQGIPGDGRTVYNPMPPIADVFDGPGAGLAPASAVFAQDSSGNFSTFVHTYSALTIPAGGTVGILHFIAEENHYVAANASAARLVQLPPEALAGLTTPDLTSIANFVVPNGGQSVVPPLGSFTNQITGFVYAADGATPIPSAGVSLQSADPIFDRLYATGTAGDGSFVFQGVLHGIVIPAENFSVSATHPITQVTSPAFPGSFPAGASSAAQNIIFTNTGTVTGTVSRGPVVLNTAGTIVLTGGVLTSPIYTPIASDGTYTITGLLPGNYVVTALVSNTLLQGVTTAAITALNTTTADITIGLAGNIQGTVTRADSSLAVNDTVNLRIPGQNPLQVIVDTSGHYLFTDIPVGTYTIDCFDPQSNSAASASIAVATNATTTQNLVLQNSGVINGNVSANDGSSVANLTVTLSSTTSNGVQNLSTTTNSTGGYSFASVTPGTIVLRVTNSEGLQGTGTGALPLAGQTVTINVALLAAGTLTGTVFQGDGVTPAAGIQVTLSPAPLTGSAVTTTNASGVYTYLNVAYGGFTVYASNIATGDRGQANGQIQVNGQLRTINITLNGFGNLTVKVVDANSNPIPNAAVTVTNGTIGQVYTATADSTGTAQFNNIFAGYFGVVARDPVSGHANSSSGTLAPGTSQTVTIALQASGTIQGVVYAPDGVTPVAGATVQEYSGIAVTTSANGSYQFLNLPLGNYYLTARDSSGIARGTASQVLLQTNGATVTQNITFLGVANVSGLVSKPDGTPAENYSLTVTSQNSTIGGARNVSTGGDGTYSISEVPIGPFTVSVNGLPSNLAGYATSAITANGVNVTVNIQIISSSVTLPITLTDADGFGYSIAGNGDYGTTGSLVGTYKSPFYDAGSLTLTVGGASAEFGTGGFPTTALQSLNGQQVEINQSSLEGLNVTRKIYVPLTGYFARRLDVLENPTSSPISVSVNIGKQGIERYTSFYPEVINTSNGNTTVDNTILWAVDADNNGAYPYPQAQPVLANVFAGAGAPTGLAAVSTTINSNQTVIGRTTYSYEYWNYTYQTVTIPANSTASFLFFTAQESTTPTATTAAQRLEQLPAEALAGLSASDLANVVNFVVPATQNLAAISPPPTNSLNGNVYAGDGTTPIPNALVYILSTDLQYGFGTSATADANGVYLAPAVVANGYTADAIDPASGVVSTAVTGTYPSNTLNQLQNIVFTNTGILQGFVQSTGAGTFLSGNISAAFPCNGVSYNNCYPTQNFGPSGVFDFLTAVGNVQVSANVTTPQNGTISLPGNYGHFSVYVPAQQTTNFTITIPATGNISGTVTNADGTPAVGVTVTATPSSNGTLVSAVTGPGGIYVFTSIVVDTYTVSSHDPITGGNVSQNVTISQDITSSVNLVFIGHGTVVVTAQYANGNIGANSQLAISTSTTPAFTYATSLTNPSGQYTFTNVPTGPYTIRAYYPGQQFYSTTTNTLSGNGTTQQTAVSLTPVGTISGNVIYAAGAPAAQAYVSISDLLGIFGTSVQTDSAGNYAVFPVPADRLINVYSYEPNNTTGKTIEAKAYNQQVPGDSQTLTVNLRYPGLANVEVTVLQTNGTPYTFGTIYLNSTDGVQNLPPVAISASGTGTFNNVVEATFVATANTGNEFNAGSKVFTITPAQDGTTVQVTINTSPSGTVQGTVFASDGTTPISSNYNVSILDIDPGNVRYACPCNAGAGYSFTGVQVGASGFTLTPQFNGVNYPSLAFNGNITSQGQVITQNFTLPVSSIGGTVYLNDGVTPVPFANVFTYETPNGGLTQYFQATADANGNYQFNGAFTGSLTVNASDSNGVVGSAAVTLTSDTQIVTGANISLSPVGMIVGTVYDANNNLVPSTDVQIQSSGNNGGFSTDVFTDTNGNYTAADIPVGNIIVSVTLPDGTTGTNTGVLNTAGSTISINIGAPPTGTVFGTVFDGNQNPNPGATVTITGSDPAMTVITATTDQNGMYIVTGVPLGVVSATALLSDGVTTVGPVTGNVPDKITPVEIDLGLSSPGNVQGIVYDMNNNPIPNVNVSLSSTGDPNTGYVESTDANGFFVFGGIAPGTISITITDTNNNTIGTATGILPYGGNVVINVTTNTVGAVLLRPQLGKAKPGTTVASTPAPRRVPAAIPPRTSAPAPAVPAAGQIVASQPAPQWLASQGGLQ
jgi:hypothetical protein